MKVLIGYYIVTVIGLAASQSLFSLLQGGPSRRIHVRRNNGRNNGLGVHDADHVNIVVPTPRRTAGGLGAGGLAAGGLAAGGLAGIGLNDFLGGHGILAGHVGRHRHIRPRTSLRLGQGGHGLPAGLLARGMGGVPSLATGGIGPSLMYSSMFDMPDPISPDLPDVVYAPRSIMGNIYQVEALRNRADADSVVFV